MSKMEQIMPGTKDNPIWMSFSPRELDKKALVIAIIVPLIPVAIAILMQKPAYRQAIQMRFFHSSKIASQRVADFFQVIATKSAQGYQKAQM
jgi:hypothetical protein